MFQISSEDNYPKYLCKECLQTAEIAYNFRLKCEETDRLLKAGGNYTDNILHSCQKCNELFTSEDELLKHLIFHKDYMCEECNIK